MKKYILLAIAGAVVTVGLAVGQADEGFNYNSKATLLRKPSGPASSTESSMTSAQYSARAALLQPKAAGSADTAQLASAGYNSKTPVRGGKAEVIELAPVK